MMDAFNIFGLLFSGGALTAAGAWLNSWIKAKSDAKIAEAKVVSETKMAEDGQEFNQQQVFFTNLIKRTEYLENAIADCVKDRMELHHLVGRLEGRLDSAESMMKHLQSTTTTQNNEILRMAGDASIKGVEVAAKIASDSATRLQNASKLTDLDLPVPEEHSQIH